MFTTLKFWPMACASVILLAGCVMGGMPPGAPHLSATQCRDLTAIRNHEPTTFRQNQSELAALETAGYDPSPFYDPYYPEDLQMAQRQVDIWYQTECLAQPSPPPLPG